MALRDTVATRADLAEVRGELRSEITELGQTLRGEMAERRGEMAELRHDLRETATRLEARIETSCAALDVDVLRGLFASQVALAGFLIASMKFMH